MGHDRSGRVRAGLDPQLPEGSDPVHARADLPAAHGRAALQVAHARVDLQVAHGLVVSDRVRVPVDSRRAARVPRVSCRAARDRAASGPEVHDRTDRRAAIQRAAPPGPSAAMPVPRKDGRHGRREKAAPRMMPRVGNTIARRANSEIVRKAVSGSGPAVSRRARTGDGDNGRVASHRARRAAFAGRRAGSSADRIRESARHR